MMELWRKVTGFLRRGQLEAELREEIQTHLAMTAADIGEDAARRRFGNVTRILEESRDAWGWPALEGGARDVRYALRMMARRIGFSAVVIATIAIGIGASGSMFSLVDAVLLRPLPYPNPKRLVSLNEARLSADQLISRVAPARLEDWQRLTRTMEAVAGWDVETFAETTGMVPEQLHVASVSPRFFAVLDTSPLLGRVFVPDEERFGGPKAIVISERLRQRRFSGAASVVGRTVRLEGRGYEIVGVMPRRFEFPDSSIDAWIATQADADLLRDRGASARFYGAIGRLNRSVTIAEARRDLDAVQRQLGSMYPTTDAGWTVRIQPLKDALVGSARDTLWLLCAAVTLLLLVACANVGCLLSAQLTSRRGELATRTALGASRAAIARQLLAEALAYSLLGGASGLLIAQATVGVMRRELAGLPRIATATVDARVVAFASLTCVAAAVVCSLAPLARIGRPDAIATVLRGGRGVVVRQPITQALVSAQLALATVLVVGATLFLRGLLALQGTPIGFEPGDVLTLRVSASFNEPPDEVVQRHQRTMDALSALPGVRSVAMSHGIPGAIAATPAEFRLADEPIDPTGAHFAERRLVTAAYFHTLGIALVSGETCRMRTDPEHEYDALVNGAFLDRYAPGRNVLDRSIIFGPQESRTPIRIVGVVENAREEGYARPVEPIVYLCGFLRWLPDSDFLIRVNGEPARLARAAREAIAAIEPGRAVYAVQPLPDILSATLSQYRLRTVLLGAFSIIALTLAAVGLWGVMAYMVSQRRREFAVRLALGAQPIAIALQIARSAGMVTMAGGGVGLLTTAAALRMSRALMAGVQISDPTAYLIGVAALLGTVVVASISPGWRAMSVDPVEILRD